MLNDNLLENFGEITWKYKIDKLINKLFNILNKIINEEGHLTTVRTTNLSNDLSETLKLIENCASCSLGKYDLDEFHKSVNEMENFLAELGKEKEEHRKRQ